jgi:hypothetical protein
MMGTSDHQEQLNYEERIRKFEATVLSSIAELEASMPEAEVQGVMTLAMNTPFIKTWKTLWLRQRPVFSSWTII